MAKNDIKLTYPSQEDRVNIDTINDNFAIIEDALNYGGAAPQEVKLVTQEGASAITIRFGIDIEGNYGYIKPGADTVTPFSKGSGKDKSMLERVYFSYGSVFKMFGGKLEQISVVEE